jgi:hypothetical protein
LINGKVGGGHTMFGLTYLIVSAERELQDNSVKSYQEARPELQIWLWRHKMLFLVTGVLVLLIIGGKGI